MTAQAKIKCTKRVLVTIPMVDEQDEGGLLDRVICVGSEAHHFKLESIALTAKVNHLAGDLRSEKMPDVVHFCGSGRGPDSSSGFAMLLQRECDSCVVNSVPRDHLSPRSSQFEPGETDLVFVLYLYHSGWQTLGCSIHPLQN